MEHKTTLVLMTTALVALLGATALPAAALPTTTGTMLVYNGDARQSSISYTQFAAAAGKDLVVSTVLGDDLVSYDCVILNINRSFTSDDLSKLATYTTGGGRLIVIGEATGFAGSANNALNLVPPAVGSSITIVGGSHDPSYWSTNFVNPATLTLGVLQVRYAYYAEVDPGLSGHTLLLDDDGQHTFLAAEQIGAGYIVVSGDSNVLSDSNGGGYTTDDNAALASNLCNGLVALGVPGI